MIEKQQNNPLHGLKNEILLAELVDFYGWSILYEALRLDCFKLNPSIESSLKFLKKTEWARIKVENFYLYRFKRMPRPSVQQFELKPRERGFADGILPRAPQELTVELIAEMKEKAQRDYEAQQALKKQKSFKPNSKSTPRGKAVSKPRHQDEGDTSNPWANWHKK
ncbi:MULTISPECIES: VF530 family DNA-binding protein [unclassified Motilimonas]|uniref:VF530 family protein n=1 Tax=Motilimonas TaxID=1914248 RepID=UPI001E47E891|nr:MULTISPECIES: VF530 family DNA-binding protein [unclassified Motilimonas]MCE0556331.1 VF530 family DNA-binding protein [Motilimonas sp. E26]MDO6525057.1 VF530 family DNA-binding protein [Motilimonas sp. 1_MG-2023]